MKNITVLGSTGSIGKNALKIIEKFPDKFNLLGISANKNHKKLIEQIKKFNPKYVCIGTEEGYKEIKKEFSNLNILMGKNGLKEMGALDEADIVLTAVSGAVGIETTIEAIKKEKRIALANKETMVAAGYLINNLLKKYKAEIIPVDSEHSAIFQAMQAGEKKEINKLIITASGGSFRGKTLKELENVSIESALNHPNWSMGKKITIDSASLVNKGLEIIEAHQLFNIDYDNIEAVIHPESIIHSMVEFKDKSIIAQLGVPDMKIPIQYAFTYPERIENSILESLDFFKISKLSFDKIDDNIFKGIKLAYQAGRAGGSMPLVFNAANEIAVDLFLKSKIKFLDIYKIIEEELGNHKILKAEDLDEIINLDKEIRKRVLERF